MAQEIQIPGAQSTAKIRSPWAVGLLSFFTVFIYFFFWYYFINREMADFGRARGTDELGDSPGKSVLAVTLGIFLIVPPFISLYHTGQRIQRTQRLAGTEPTMNGWLAVVMYLLFSPIMVAYWQSELNKVWERLGGLAPPDPPYPADPTPPPPIA
jgi:hypothetical protein